MKLSYLVIAGEAAPRPLRFFVFLTQVPWPNRATDFALGDRGDCPSLSLSITDTQKLPSVFVSSSCQMRLEATLYTGWGYDSAFLPGNGQSRLQGWQNSLFEDPSQADLNPTEFLGQITLLTWFCILAKSMVYAYYLG